MNKDIIYFVRTQRAFANLGDASDFMTEHGYSVSEHHIGYYMPQPRYKTWIPFWVIDLITKK